MKLKKLLKDIPVKDIKGSKDIEVSGICSNSKLVSPGNLFVARKGLSDDGSHYIPEALAAGASAVLTDIYDPTLKNVCQILHHDVSSLEGPLAMQYYQNPSNELFMVGITGTNGKTTTSFLIKHLLDQLSVPAGLLGTIEYIIGQHRYQATRTTPDVISNHKMLREMVNQGCRSAVMEVTSHALAQGRVYGIDFDIAIFTNLTLDHLDYHQTMENYCSAKNKLFRSLKTDKSKKKIKQFPTTAVINIDSGWSEKIREGCQVDILTYGIDNPAHLQALDICLTPSGTKFKLKYKDQIVDCFWPLVGRFNVYNYLAAISVGLVRNIALEKLTNMMANFSAVPGRLEPVPNPLGLKIYVDFAHSDDALVNVFETLNELKTGKLITVFGCGGDRDRSKRPRMAKVSGAYSDVSIVTSDNPRTENPEAIIDEVVKGFEKGQRFESIVDRRSAIEKAIEIATEDDIILIAGKGHETYQIFAHKTIEFDDRKVASELCQSKYDALLTHN